jgi:hypothetical protein
MCTGAELLAIGGTAFSAVGQIQSANAESAALERDAQLERQRGEFEKARLDEQQEQLIGRQRVAAGKSGATSSGSILETMRGSAEQAELDALNIEFGTQAGVQSRLFESSQAKKSGLIGAGGTLLTGASKSGVFD